MKLLVIGGPGLKFLPDAAYVFARDPQGEIKRTRPKRRGELGRPLLARNHTRTCHTQDPNEDCGICEFKREGVQMHTFVTFCEGPHAGREKRCNKGERLIFEHVGYDKQQSAMSPQDFIDKGLATVVETGLPTCCAACIQIVTEARKGAPAPAPPQVAKVAPDVADEAEAVEVTEKK